MEDVDNWENDKQIITEKYYELINCNNLKLIDLVFSNNANLRGVVPLIEFILSRLETVTFLAEDERVWDAEIVMRSALETFIKFLFITKSESDERDLRLKEYWESLSEINSLKLSEQAKRNLKFFGNSEIHKIAYSPLILPTELENYLRNKWPRKDRQKLEQKWSFSEMIKSISSDFKNHPIEMIDVLTHSYRMSSHVMHGDETGLLIIRERDSRVESEQKKAYRAHYVRLFSDCLTYCAFIGIEVVKYLNLDKEHLEFFFSNHNKIEEIDELIDQYKDQVFDDPMYDIHRGKD